MRPILVVGFALATAGCTGPQSYRIALPLPVQLIKEALAVDAPSFCYVDGMETRCSDAALIPQDRVQRIQMIHGRPAALLSGGRATNGVMLILTRP